MSTPGIASPLLAGSFVSIAIAVLVTGVTVTLGGLIGCGIRK